MKKVFKKVLVLMAAAFILCGVVFAPMKAYAATADETAIEASADSSTGSKAWAAGVALCGAAGLGALGMGIAIAKSAEGISRQPEAEGKIRTTLMLGLVFIETAIIYALVVAILIIFVL